MEEVKQQVRAYFHQPGFRRLLPQIWKRYAALERAGGTVTLENLTEEECDAVNGFFGWFKQPGDTVRVSLKRFEEELAASPFPPTIPALHQTLEGTQLKTRSERQMQRDHRWQSVFGAPCARVEAAADEAATPVANWVHRLRSGEAAGHRTLRDVYHSDPDVAQQTLLHVVEALLALRSEKTRPNTAELVRLPVLANRVTGDAHAFDWKTPAGRLLWYGIREIEQADVEVVEADSGVDAGALREVYRLAGIGDDDISSQVMYYVADGSRDVFPTVMTLRQLEKATSFPACSDLFVVENPSVFSTLLDVTEKAFSQRRGGSPPALDGRSPVLICTNGQPSVAAIRMMKGIIDRMKGGLRLHYSGDFDAAGLQMAVALSRRFPAVFVPWCMAPSIYERYADNGPELKEAELQRLPQSPSRWEEQLVKIMMRKRRKCFQEACIEELAGDWLRGLESLLSQKLRHPLV